MASNKLKINTEEVEDKFVPIFEEEAPKPAEETKAEEAPKTKNTSKPRKFAKFKGK